MVRGEDRGRDEQVVRGKDIDKDEQVVRGEGIGRDEQVVRGEDTVNADMYKQTTEVGKES